MKWFVACYVLFISLSSRPIYGADSGWVRHPSHTSSNLRGVSFSDANTWIAVGDGGTIVRSTDGGGVWSTLPSPVGDHLRGVSFRGNVGVAVGLAGRVLRSTDSGANWIQETRPTSRNLYAVSIGASFAVITGEEGTILVSTDTGQTWSPRTAGTASILFGVSIFGPTAVGVGGQATAVNSVDTGGGWGLEVLGPTQQLFFYGISLVSATTGWAVGSYAPTGSIIIKSTNSGFTWGVQSAPTTNILFGVAFASADSGTAVGFNGTIVHTTNGGIDWTNQESNTLQALNAVAFVNAHTGIAVGDSGTILRTTNGGLTDVEQQSAQTVPSEFRLEQNYPNPFNPTTVIRYQVPTPGGVEGSGASHVRLAVFDLLGREVSVLVNEQKAAGRHEVTFNASGLSSGIYLYRLEVRAEAQGATFSSTKRLVLLR